MRPGLRFGQILDEKLAHAGQAGAGPAPRGTTPAFGPPAFLFGSAPFLAGAARPAVSSAYAAAMPAARPAPRRSSLSPAQARALDCLRSLGAASIDAAFTEAELKSVFRSLARTFHPDRHADASDRERERLSRAFATACDAYRELTRVFAN